MKLLKISYLSLTLLIAIFSLPTISLANESIESKCGYQKQPGINPSYQVVNCLLTETALQYNIPPEIVKGMAEVESGSWKQFHHDGRPIITDDGGIGIMQITLYQEYNQERLKTDIVYNIQAGVEMLDKMFTRQDLPKINSHERNVIEHWYFAVMAYNGIKPVNSPIIQATNKPNLNAYQEKVFKVIEEGNLIQLSRFHMDKSHFQYETTSSENIKFLIKNYKTSETLTVSKHDLKQGEIASISLSNVSLRENATTESAIKHRLTAGQNVLVLNSFTYDQSMEKKRNHFVWYHVQLMDGTKGYVASSYIVKSRLTNILALTINSKTVHANGYSNQLLAAPYINNGRTLVPLRFISEQIGAKVDWMSQSKTIAINTNGKTMTLQVGNKNVVITTNISKSTHAIEVAPVIRNGTTFVPLRFISEHLGASVNWDQATKSITVLQ
jgi:hypothetical protein